MSRGADPTIRTPPRGHVTLNFAFNQGSLEMLINRVAKCEKKIQP